jgi:hypothetical protein
MSKKGEVEEKKVEGGVTEALNEMELEGGGKTESPLNFDELYKDVKAYELGINKSGRSKSSEMLRYRTSLKAFLDYLVSRGEFRVEVGAVVSNFSARILNNKHYRKSYNYFWSCVQHKHLPEGWEIARKGERGCNQNTLIYTLPEASSPDASE